MSEYTLRVQFKGEGSWARFADIPNVTSHNVIKKDGVITEITGERSDGLPLLMEFEDGSIEFVTVVPGQQTIQRGGRDKGSTAKVCSWPTSKRDPKGENGGCQQTTADPSGLCRAHKDKAADTWTWEQAETYFHECVGRGEMPDREFLSRCKVLVREDAIDTWLDNARQLLDQKSGGTTEAENQMAPESQVEDNWTWERGQEYVQERRQQGEMPDPAVLLENLAATFGERPELLDTLMGHAKANL